MAKKIGFYKIRSFFNASHALSNQQGQSSLHNHTWEVSVETQPLALPEPGFEVVEQAVQQVLDLLQDQELNKLPAFKTTEPTLIEVTKYIANQLETVLAQQKLVLVRVEVGNTPLRYYCIDMTN